MRASIVLAIGAILLSTLGRSQTLDLQAMCAEQARKAFQEWEHAIKNDPEGKLFRTVSSHYQRHYNTKLKKCLVLIEAIRMLDNQQSIVADLIDAFERRPYASYHGILREGKEGAPMTCKLTASYRQKKKCTTREEFDAFVAGYMEE